MAILGKFETTLDILCMGCKMRLKIRAHSLDWTGDLRTEPTCTTPGCTNALDTLNKQTKGNVSSKTPVQLLTLPDGSHIILEEYECTDAEALHFCHLFRDVLQRIPTAAKDAILAHWQTGRGSPHVWLLKDRGEWGGRGWAATKTEGLSLCFVSALIGQLPDEHIKTAIAHEFGHTLFHAGGEPHHAQPATTLESMMDQTPFDPRSRMRQEWLVWRLMEAWCFDQPALEEWMERNTIDNADGISVRQSSQRDVEFRGKCIADRARYEKLLKDMVFPIEFEKYRNR